MDPKHIRIDDYTYPLSPEYIAAYPLPNRDDSRLLVYRDKLIEEDTFNHLGHYLPAGSMLVLNNSKVVAARILFKKDTGGSVEIFCLEPAEGDGDISTSMQTHHSVRWNCLIGGASKWKPGQELHKTVTSPSGPCILTAKYLQKNEGSFIIQLSWTDSQLNFAGLLEIAGDTPLPPYLHREAEKVDRERYQTVFAHTEGSVAAPTAGLHFTDALMTALAVKKIRKEYVTLHVGAGTFQPVKASRMEEHLMHSEFIDVSLAAVKNIFNHFPGPLTAVGTTSLRTLETLYWMGIKAAKGFFSEDTGIAVEQWEPYSLTASALTRKQAFECLIDWMEQKNISRILTKTAILIAPGYTIRTADALITNFHQPRSTLLLLVAAFIGDDWKNVYDYALKNNFRFLSYGDGSLLFRPLPAP